MVTVAELLNFVQSLAPRSLAEGWDNVGLLCGDPGRPVRRVFLALDPFLPVCQEAAAWEADVLLTHHPLIFSPLKAITPETEPGACAMTLIAHNIAAVNAHTNLDQAPGGVNDCLAQALGLKAISVLKPQGVDDQGRPWGLLRTGTLEPMDAEAFLARVKSALGTPALRHVSPKATVGKVCVGGGACGGALYEAAAAGCDAFVTADVKYNQFRDAEFLGLNLIDAGHFYTENPVMTMLKRALEDKFPELTVKISENHHDSMKFY